MIELLATYAPRRAQSAVPYRATVPTEHGRLGYDFATRQFIATGKPAETIASGVAVSVVILAAGVTCVIIGSHPNR